MSVQILRSCNAYKLRFGFAVAAIFPSPGSGVQRRSFYQRKKDAPYSIPFERGTCSTFPELLRHPFAQVRYSLTRPSSRRPSAPLTSEARRKRHHRIDDSLFGRSESGAGPRHDHVSGTYVKGFACSRSAGVTEKYLPAVSHCLPVFVVEAAATTGRVRKTSSAQQRRQVAQAVQCKAQCSPDTAAGSAQRWVSLPVPRSVRLVVLLTTASPTRSWLGYDVIARVKKSEKMHFSFQGRMQDAGPSTGARRSAADTPLTCSP